MKAGVRVGVALLLAASLESLVSGAPITKAQLLAMGSNRVDTKVMLDLVERDCVDFDVDAANVLELSKAVPPAVIEAAMGCRKNVAAASTPPPTPLPPVAAAPTVVSAAPAPAPVPSEAKATDSAVPGAASLRVRAEFIDESHELTCRFLLDGKPFATLTKPANGEFGQAVERAKVRKYSDLVPVTSGRHVVLAACDPGDKDMKVEVDLAPGSRISVDFRETTFRNWKLLGVFSVP